MKNILSTILLLVNVSVFAATTTSPRPVFTIGTGSGGSSIVTTNGATYNFNSTRFTVTTGTNVDLNTIDGSYITANTINSNRVISVDGGQIIGYGVNITTNNVKLFGAKGDTVTDDTVSINKCIQFCQTNGGGLVYFPPGTYKITSPLYVTNSNVHILGDGTASRILASGINTNIVHFTLSAAPSSVGLMHDSSIENIWIDSSTAMNNGYGAYFNLSVHSYVRNVTFGTFTANTASANNLTNDLFFQGQGGIVINHCVFNFKGVGVGVVGVDGYGSAPFGSRLQSYSTYIGDYCEFNGPGAATGGSVGIWLGGVCGGVWVDQGNVTQCSDGILVSSGSMRELFVNHIWLDGCSSNAIHVVGGLTFLSVKNTWLVSSGMAGILVDTAATIGNGIAVENTYIWGNNTGIWLRNDPALIGPTMYQIIGNSFASDGTGAGNAFGDVVFASTWASSMDPGKLGGPSFGIISDNTLTIPIKSVTSGAYTFNPACCNNVLIDPNVGIPESICSFSSTTLGATAMINGESRLWNNGTNLYVIQAAPTSTAWARTNLLTSSSVSASSGTFYTTNYQNGVWLTNQYSTAITLSGSAFVRFDVGVEGELDIQVPGSVTNTIWNVNPVGGSPQSMCVPFNVTIPASKGFCFTNISYAGGPGTSAYTTNGIQLFIH